MRAGIVPDFSLPDHPICYTRGKKMVYRGAKPREAKRIHGIQVSTLEDKYRRHRNKARIWRRAVKRLSRELQIESTQTDAPLGAAVV